MREPRTMYGIPFPPNDEAVESTPLDPGSASTPPPPAEAKVESLEQEIEDLLADIVDLLVSHTEGPDSFGVSRRVDEKDPDMVWFIVSPRTGKAPGIVIGHRGTMAGALRTLVKNVGYAHKRKFRLLLDTPPPTEEDRARRRTDREGGRS